MKSNEIPKEIFSFTLIEKDKYEINFLGSKSTISGQKEYILNTMEKYSKAYSLIPKGSVVIPENKVSLYDNKLIGGILRDSLYAVYGIGRDGLSGYSCSVYFTPSTEYLNSVLDYPETDLIIK